MTATQTAVQLVSAITYFEEVEPSVLETIGRAAVRRAYEAEQVVFVEGEPCAGVYLVQEGWLKSVKVSPAGREQVLRFVGPGEVFNEIGVLAGATNLVTVIALERAIVWVIPRETVLRLLEEHPSLARLVAQRLAQRVLHLMTLVEDLSLRSVEARLARFLLAESSAGALHRRAWTTQAEMAARLGTVPDVLNRALRGLVEEGLIQVDRHQIRILNPSQLKVKAMLEM